MPRIALAQMSMCADVAANLGRSERAIGAASEKGANIVVFPELQLSPFFPQYPDFEAGSYQSVLDGSEVLKLRQSCARFGMIGVLNVFLEMQGATYDASIVVDADGRVLGISRMVHVTQAPCFFEQAYYAPAPDGFRVYETDCGRIGVVICFDRHYPESFRSCALQGADLIVIPTANVHGEPLEMFEWELRVAAYHNSVYVAMCNRVGQEDQMVFCGESLIVDPDGRVIARAGRHEAILTADIDVEFVRARRRENRYLELRRPEAFAVGGPAE
jgi:N-carbamoylputrescine amidase